MEQTGHKRVVIARRSIWEGGRSLEGACRSFYGAVMASRCGRDVFNLQRILIWPVCDGADALAVHTCRSHIHFYRSLETPSAMLSSIHHSGAILEAACLLTWFLTGEERRRLWRVSPLTTAWRKPEMRKMAGESSRLNGEYMAPPDWSTKGKTMIGRILPLVTASLG